jgi:periplasmic protein TonB
MFEDSLVESQGRIRTQSRWFAIGSFFAQAVLLVLLVLYPLLNPLALPRQAVERLLVAPPPPMAPAHVETRASAPAAHQPVISLQDQLQAPSKIPSHIATINGSAAQTPPGFNVIGGSQDGPGIPGGIPLGSPPPAVTLAPRPAPKRILISTGVATGLLLSPIRPVYPAIAKVARIQGTVLIAATISRQGTIENLQVMEGPPMLRQAAIDAVAAARYRPFLLNGEPVEVETSIRVIFSLGG